MSYTDPCPGNCGGTKADCDCKPVCKLEDWQQRVVDEKQQLDEKIKKLSMFLLSEKFTNMADINGRSLLIKQRAFMVAYSDVLQQRIDLF